MDLSTTESQGTPVWKVETYCVDHDRDGLLLAAGAKSSKGIDTLIGVGLESI